MSAAHLPDIDPRRAIAVEGASNVRDLGGYETLDGRQTRWRALFRAADIHALSPSAQSTLIDAGVRTVIDLRGSRELTEAPSVFKDLSGVQYRPAQHDRRRPHRQMGHRPRARRLVDQAFDHVLDRSR